MGVSVMAGKGANNIHEFIQSDDSGRTVKYESENPGFQGP